MGELLGLYLDSRVSVREKLGLEDRQVKVGEKVLAAFTPCHTFPGIFVFFNSERVNIGMLVCYLTAMNRSFPEILYHQSIEDMVGS